MNAEERRLLVEVGGWAARAQSAEAKLVKIESLCDRVIARTGLAPDLVREIRAAIKGSES